MYDLYDFPLYRPPSEAYSLIIQIFQRKPYKSLIRNKLFLIYIKNFN